MSRKGSKLQQAKRNTMKIALQNARKRELTKPISYSYRKDYNLEINLYG